MKGLGLNLSHSPLQQLSFRVCVIKGLLQFLLPGVATVAEKGNDLRFNNPKP